MAISPFPLPTHLRRLLHSELALLFTVRLIATEVLSIEQRQRVVGVALGVRRGIAQYEVHAQGPVVGALEADGPTVVPVVEVLGGRISVQVTRHRTGDDEGEDACIVAVVQFGEAVQQRHRKRRRF